MCQFPSWIKKADGSCFWNTDSILEDHNINFVDGVGHSAVEAIWKVRGQHLEGLVGVPPKFLEDIKAGKCAKMMKAAGIHALTILGGKLHSFNDEPAFVTKDTKTWFKNGRIHRDGDLPAKVSSWRKEFYKNGLRHRDGDKPAIMDNREGNSWYVKGSRFREGGKPHRVGVDGTEYYYKGRRLHRGGDLPAIVHPDGTLEFYQNGRRHRDGGKPAIVRADGALRFYVNGKRVPAPKNVKAVAQKSVPVVVDIPKVQELPQKLNEVALEAKPERVTMQDLLSMEKYESPVVKALRVKAPTPALK